MEYRFDYRQQHTGQHILSSVFMNLGNYPTVSIHQGQDLTSIEFESSDIDSEFILKAEERANELICRNTPVKIHITDREGLARFPIRRPTEQQKEIRIVEIVDVDMAACGGLHLNSTGEAGFIKYISSEKIRGNTRTFWKIGRRALKDYRQKTEITSELSVLFSRPPGGNNRRRKTAD